MGDFPRKCRLTSKNDFQSVFAARPGKIKFKYLLLLYHPSQKSYARVGLTFSKQHAKLAVTRNTIKRIARESFRQHKELLKGLDIILLLRSECTPLLQESGKKKLRADFEQLWQLLINAYKKA